jgi:hypothetical protein
LDDHFWPLLYPALIMGSLFGFARGGLVNAGLGALGALGGAVVSFFILAALGIDNGAVTFAVLVASSWLGALAFLSVRQAVSGR